MMTALLTFLFFITAALYAAVGNGGGSGYLALMSLAGLPPEVMKPTALALNVLVASIGAWKYIRAGHFSARLFWPIAAMSVPFAFLGGRLSLDGDIYQSLVGVVLLYAAFRLWRGARADAAPVRQIAAPLWAALVVGALIGLLSGLLGIGGGIFLGPVLLLGGWSNTRQTMGITAAFVLVNSIAGLLGLLSSSPTLPPGIWAWLVAAGTGGWLGAEYGSQRLNSQFLRRLLAVVLVLGSARLLLS
jgi:uncharacterized protein